MRTSGGIDAAASTENPAALTVFVFDQEVVADGFEFRVGLRLPQLVTVPCE